MGMYRSIRWYLQRRSKKRFQKDLSKCFYRMLYDVMGLEDLDVVFTSEQIEAMGAMRRVLMELKKHLPYVRPLGFTAVLTEIKAVSRAEEDKKVTATDKEEDKKED